MDKAELSARIATETSLSTAGADGAVAGLFPTIDDVLASGRTDRIAGFGTFSMKSRPARQAGNPGVRPRSSPSTPRRRPPSSRGRQDPPRDRRSRAGPSRRSSSRKSLASRTERIRAAALPTTVASGAGGRRGDLCGRSILQTEAQSRAEIESPRARVPCIAGFGSSPATVMRATPHVVQRQLPGRYRSDELPAPTATRREPCRPLSCHDWLWSALDNAAAGLTTVVARQIAIRPGEHPCHSQLSRWSISQINQTPMCKPPFVPLIGRFRRTSHQFGARSGDLRLHGSSFDPKDIASLVEEFVQGEAVLYIVEEGHLPGAAGYHAINGREMPYGFVFITDPMTGR